MIRDCAIIFGYNEYSKQIAQQIYTEYPNFVLYTMSETKRAQAKAAGFESEIFDLSDDWKIIEERFDPARVIAFCALENDAENVFLTISLRSSFEDIAIIALAQDHESAVKLTSAGANKVMPILQITANIIVEMLEKPTVTEVFHEILYENSALKIAQVTVPEGAFIVGKHLHDLDCSEKYDIIILAIVDHELGATFSFTSKGHNHHIDPGDILIIVGYEDKIETYTKALGIRV